MNFPRFPLSALAMALTASFFPAPSGFLRAEDPASETALDRYVKAPDPAYEYEAVNSGRGGGVTFHALRMVSQTWLDEAAVDSPTWWHWLNLYVPDDAGGDTALLVISGGDTESDRPRPPDETYAKIAQATGSVVAELRMVPNQPLVFHGDGEERKEDNLIAYGWKQYLEGGAGEPEWLARLPMTKSAVRAMDTVTDFLGKEENGGRKVDRFVVAGASKRGWTTWTTAAVDERVVGIAPIVIDMLNVQPSFRHHYAAYGFYAPAVGDYVRHGVMDWQGRPEYEKLASIADPFAYRERFTMPKLLLNAAGDQFFLPDSHRFYFDDLPGPKYLRYVPNANHSLKGSDAPETLAAWHHALIRGRDLPDFGWEIDWEKGRIRVEAGDRPEKLLLWQASNPEARDFRLATIGEAWTSRELELDGEGRLEVTVPAPEKGWTAFFVEATYPLEDFPAPLKFTSGVAVAPDTLPFEEEAEKLAEEAAATAPSE